MPGGQVGKGSTLRAATPVTSPCKPVDGLAHAFFWTDRLPVSTPRAYGIFILMMEINFYLAIYGPGGLMNLASQEPDSTTDAGPLGNPSDSPWTDIRNWVSFLIAGFGAVLTFVGFRSTEVSTVLRNDSIQVAVVSVALLLGVLAAIYSLVIDRTTAIPVRQCATIFGSLAGAAVLMVYATPIQVSRENAVEQAYAAIGGLLIFLSVITEIKWRSRNSRTTNKQITFIGASVVLIGISILGAMRTETDSQLSPAVQVSGEVTNNASGITVSAHVSGVKLGDSRYVELQILGLLSGGNESKQCKAVRQHPTTASCTEAPCTENYSENQCQLLVNGTVQPDASGNVNETISNGVTPGKFQDIAIVGLVCDSNKGCDPLSKHGSRFDLRLPTPAPAN